MEELKKDVESVKILSTQKSFMESVNEMNMLKSKVIHDDSMNSDKYRDISETEINQ
jgi:hypothetical protein